MTIPTTPLLTPPNGGRQPMNAQAMLLPTEPPPSYGEITPDSIAPPMASVNAADVEQAVEQPAVTAQAVEQPPVAAVAVEQVVPAATPGSLRRPPAPGGASSAVPRGSSANALTAEQLGRLGEWYIRGDDLAEIAKTLRVAVDEVEAWVARYPAMGSKRADNIAAREAQAATRAADEAAQRVDAIDPAAGYTADLTEAISAAQAAIDVKIAAAVAAEEAAGAVSKTELAAEVAKVRAERVEVDQPAATPKRRGRPPRAQTAQVEQAPQVKQAEQVEQAGRIVASGANAERRLFFRLGALCASFQITLDDLITCLRTTKDVVDDTGMDVDELLEMLS